jgi:hypothetical protein
MKLDDVKQRERAATSDGATIEIRRAQFMREITRYVGTLKSEDALRLEEFRQLSTTQKIIAQRNSVLAGDIRWARANPYADIALAVRNLVNFVADMADGCCWLSAKRIGELYGRDERTIRRYLDRLCSANLMRKVERPGKPQGYFPVIDRGLVDLAASPTWFVDAFSAPPLRAGRPSAENPGHLCPPFFEEPRTPDAGVTAKTPDTSCKNPGHLCPPESSLRIERKGGGAEGYTTQLNTSEPAHPAALDAETSDVCWTRDGRIEVANGFKGGLQADFPGVNLTDGLAIVAGEQIGDDGKPRAHGLKLMGAIRRKFGYLANDNRLKGAQRPIKRPTFDASKVRR